MSPAVFLIYFISAAGYTCCVFSFNGPVLHNSANDFNVGFLTLHFCFSVCLPSFPVCGIDPACWSICACVVSEQIPICYVTLAPSIPVKALTAVTDNVQIFQNAGWASESVWTDKDNVALTGIRSRTVQTISSS